MKAKSKLFAMVISIQQKSTLAGKQFKDVSWAYPEGGRGPGPHEKSQNIGLLTNCGQDPLKNHQATKPEFNVGHHQHTSETPFKWRFAGGQIMARFYLY